MYYVVFKDWNSGLCRWVGYPDKAYFTLHYRRSFGEIVAQGVTREEAMRLCGAPEAMITDEDKGE